MRWRFTLNPDTDNLVIAEPIGWKEIEFELNRHREWHGLFFEYGIPLKFYDNPKVPSQNAYTFIKNAYEADGIQAEIFLKVENACNDTDGFTAEGIWRLDFGKYKEHLGVLCLAEAGLEPENLLMTFINRYDQKVDIGSLTSFDGSTLDEYAALPFDNLELPPKAVPVTSDIEFGGTAEDINFTETDLIVAGTGTSSHNVIIYVQAGYNVVNLDEIATRFEIESGAFGSLGDIGTLYSINIPGLYTLTLTSFIFTVNLQADSDGQDEDSCSVPNKYADLDVKLYLEIAGVTTLVDSGTLSGCLDSSDTVTISVAGYSITQNLLAGDDIRIYARIEGSGTYDRDLLTQHDLVWTFNYNQVGRHVVLTAYEYAPSTVADVFLINETGSRILESITDDGFRLLSDYYGRTDSEPYTAPSGADGCGSLRCLTSGLIIRSYSPYSKLVMSFKEFFDGLNAIDNIGIGLEDDGSRAGFQVVRMEPMEYFYDPTVMLQLDKIPSAIRTVVLEEHISIFKGGYSKWEAEEYTGLDEFNTGREYRTGLNSVHTTLDRVCNFIASGYAIEITRRIKQYNPFTQEDWRFDKDTFIICIKRGDSADFEVEQGNIFDDSDLIDAASIYNFRISPARNAIRWLRAVLNSYRDPEAAESELIFTDGDGNILASGLMTGDCIIENAPIAENQNLSVLDAGDPWDGHPLYVPELWEFEYPLSFSDYQTIKATPTRTIQGRFLQETSWRDFFIRVVKYRPNEGLATWQMLPKRAYPIDDCLIYIIHSRGIGSNTFGSALLKDAGIGNLFVFVGGNLMKYNCADTAANEITFFDPTTGYGTLNFDIPEGVEVRVVHIPPGDGHCDACIHRFEGSGNDSDEVKLTGFGSIALSGMFVFYNGELMKYNDLVAPNNELLSYVGGTEILTFSGMVTDPRVELRAIGFANCTNIKTFTGHGDGTDTPAMTGLGLDASLANTFIFYDGNLMQYNNGAVASNEIESFTPISGEVDLTITTDANRELRSIKLVN